MIEFSVSEETMNMVATAIMFYAFILYLIINRTNMRLLLQLTTALGLTILAVSFFYGVIV